MRVTAEAERAAVADQMRGDDDAVARGDAPGLPGFGTDLLNDPDHLMTRDHRKRRGPEVLLPRVILLDIGSAEPARFDA